MTVEQLIDKLRKFPLTATIVVEGDECVFEPNEVSQCARNYAWLDNVVDDPTVYVMISQEVEK